jgi:hypothetical protein
MSDQESAPAAADPTHDKVPAVSRRGIVSGLAIGGVAVGAGATGGWVSRSGGGGGYHRKQLTVDVACLAHKWREGAKGDQLNNDDIRAPFLVEGWIYPGGTIAGDGFIADEKGSIGRWFCRGYLVIDGDRQEPHAASNHEFMFGSITPTRLFPPDMIATCGIEGTSSREQLAHRAVIGGTGIYLGATGQVHQRYIADNNTEFLDGSGPGLCFRFDFDIRVFD